MSFKAYNELLVSEDSDRLRKILVRTALFDSVREIPGDIVECGVFKGAGLFTWAKLAHIWGVNKTTYGFDMFSHFPTEGLDYKEKYEAGRLVSNADYEGITPRELDNIANKARLDISLVAGDVEETIPAWVGENPNIRLCLVNMDLDFYKSTLVAIRALWPLLSKGGIMIFDEYGIKEYTESEAVDEFFGGGRQLEAIPWAKSPTAFIRK